jgi:hypothetical protein
MKHAYHMALVLTFVSATATAQEMKLPPRVESLTKNYEAAIARATAPITKTYRDELTKLKSEYTKSGDLTSAVAIEELIQRLSEDTASPTGAKGITKNTSTMSLDDFKQWLSTIDIITGSNETIRYIDGVITMQSPRDAVPRRYPAAMVPRPGRVEIPLSAGMGVVEFNERLSKVTIEYPNGKPVPVTMKARKN